MTAQVPEFWHVSYPVRPDGSTYQEIASDEFDARRRARAASSRYSHATVTNRAGLVATYVNGKEWAA